MERYGVGRPAIREALLSLEQAGLISVGGGERARVAKPSAEAMLAGLAGSVRQFLRNAAGVRHLQDARTVLEVGLVRDAARSATPDDIERLHAALAANEAAVGNLQQFERTDVAFHFVFAAMSHNPIFTALHQAMVAWLLEQRSTTLTTQGADRGAAECHRRIFQAVAAHDPDAAEREMRAHLDAVGRLYWQARDAERAA
jgi:DNA-binding FadR family transcriptional regulator